MLQALLEECNPALSAEEVAKGDSSSTTNKPFEESVKLNMSLLEECSPGPRAEETDSSLPTSKTTAESVKQNMSLLQERPPGPSSEETTEGEFSSRTSKMFEDSVKLNMALLKEYSSGPSAEEITKGDSSSLTSKTFEELAKLKMALLEECPPGPNVEQITKGDSSSPTGKPFKESVKLNMTLLEEYPPRHTVTEIAKGDSSLPTSKIFEESALLEECLPGPNAEQITKGDSSSPTGKPFEKSVKLKMALLEEYSPAASAAEIAKGGSSLLISKTFEESVKLNMLLLEKSRAVKKPEESFSPTRENIEESVKHLEECPIGPSAEEITKRDFFSTFEESVKPMRLLLEKSRAVKKPEESFSPTRENIEESVKHLEECPIGPSPEEITKGDSFSPFEESVKPMRLLLEKSRAVKKPQETFSRTRKNIEEALKHLEECPIGPSAEEITKGDSFSPFEESVKPMRLLLEKSRAVKKRQKSFTRTRKNIEEALKHLEECPIGPSAEEITKGDSFSPFEESVKPMRLLLEKSRAVKKPQESFSRTRKNIEEALKHLEECPIGPSAEEITKGDSFSPFEESVKPMRLLLEKSRAVKKPQESFSRTRKIIEEALKHLEECPIGPSAEEITKGDSYSPFEESIKPMRLLLEKSRAVKKRQKSFSRTRKKIEEAVKHLEECPIGPSAEEITKGDSYSPFEESVKPMRLLLEKSRAVKKPQESFSRTRKIIEEAVKHLEECPIGPSAEEITKGDSFSPFEESVKPMRLLLEISRAVKKPQESFSRTRKIIEEAVKHLEECPIGPSAEEITKGDSFSPFEESVKPMRLLLEKSRAVKKPEESFSPTKENIEEAVKHLEECPIGLSAEEITKEDLFSPFEESVKPMRLLLEKSRAVKKPEESFSPTRENIEEAVKHLEECPLGPSAEEITKGDFFSPFEESVTPMRLLLEKSRAVKKPEESFSPTKENIEEAVKHLEECPIGPSAVEITKGDFFSPFEESVTPMRLLLEKSRAVKKPEESFSPTRENIEESVKHLEECPIGPSAEEITKGDSFSPFEESVKPVRLLQEKCRAVKKPEESFLPTKENIEESIKHLEECPIGPSAEEFTKGDTSSPFEESVKPIRLLMEKSRAVKKPEESFSPTRENIEESVKQHMALLEEYPPRPSVAEIAKRDSSSPTSKTFEESVKLNMTLLEECLPGPSAEQIAKGDSPSPTSKSFEESVKLSMAHLEEYHQVQNTAEISKRDSSSLTGKTFVEPLKLIKLLLDEGSPEPGAEDIVEEGFSSPTNKNTEESVKHNMAHLREYHLVLSAAEIASGDPTSPTSNIFKESVKLNMPCLEERLPVPSDEEIVNAYYFSPTSINTKESENQYMPCLEERLPVPSDEEIVNAYYFSPTSINTKESENQYMPLLEEFLSGTSFENIVKEYSFWATNKIIEELVKQNMMFEQTLHKKRSRVRPVPAEKYVTRKYQPSNTIPWLRMKLETELPHISEDEDEEKEGDETVEAEHPFLLTCESLVENAIKVVNHEGEVMASSVEIIKDLAELNTTDREEISSPLAVTELVDTVIKVVEAEKSPPVKMESSKLTIPAKVPQDLLDYPCTHTTRREMERMIEVTTRDTANTRPSILILVKEASELNKTALMSNGFEARLERQIEPGDFFEAEKSFSVQDPTNEPAEQNKMIETTPVAGADGGHAADCSEEIQEPLFPNMMIETAPVAGADGVHAADCSEEIQEPLLPNMMIETAPVAGADGGHAADCSEEIQEPLLPIMMIETAPVAAADGGHAADCSEDIQEPLLPNMMIETAPVAAADGGHAADCSEDIQEPLLPNMMIETAPVAGADRGHAADCSEEIQKPLLPNMVPAFEEEGDEIKRNTKMMFVFNATADVRRKIPCQFTKDTDVSSIKNKYLQAREMGDSQEIADAGSSARPAETDKKMEAGEPFRKSMIHYKRLDIQDRGTAEEKNTSTGKNDKDTKRQKKTSLSNRGSANHSN
ncbi:hypothetical protein NDU88_005314 [Pleurodeles waltl]|uniref:Uncharacterized protein n=1 Tax=Pleurodeles waltl TaxID=8319 RepID=A0AAV7M9L6_PLEWA|nr:hypothetical protein NDU88_005314 [Pleurodeles waltl]